MKARTMCLDCAHFQGGDGDVPTCEAFPGGIPVEILQDGFDHRGQEFPGDNGIRFEPVEDADWAYLETFDQPEAGVSDEP